MGLNLRVASPNEVHKKSYSHFRKPPKRADDGAHGGRVDVPSHTPLTYHVPGVRPLASSSVFVAVRDHP